MNPILFSLNSIEFNIKINLKVHQDRKEPLDFIFFIFVLTKKKRMKKDKKFNLLERYSHALINRVFKTLSI